MKKMIILVGLVLAISDVQVFAACPIEPGAACKADIGGFNNNLQDKILPNNLDNITKPNNSFNNRSRLGQPNLPDSINMEPAQEENTQPYNANCQFGNCLNRNNAGQNGNN